MTLDTGQTTLAAVYLSHTLTAQGKKRKSHFWGDGSCIQEQSEQVDTVGGRLCSSKRMKWPVISSGTCDWLIGRTLCLARSWISLNWRSGWVKRVSLLGGWTRWKTFPTGDRAAYVVRAEQLMAKPLGTCEGQRCQGGTWSFRPSKTHLPYRSFTLLSPTEP